MSDRPWEHVTDQATRDRPVGDDLDWVRRRMIELDDAQRALPADDLAARHAIHQTLDDLRTMLRRGYAAAIHDVRERWGERAGRKGTHAVDYEAIAHMVRSMVPGDGGGGF